MGYEGGWGYNGLEHSIFAMSEELREVLGLVRHIAKKENEMATDLTDLQKAVASDTEVTTSAVVLLRQLSDMLTEAKDDPAAIAAIADALKANVAELSDAVVANTPQEPSPPVTPVEPEPPVTEP